MTSTLLKLFIAITSRLPLPLARLLGRLAGEVSWRLNTRARFITSINLELCFPGMDGRARERLARSSLQHWGMTIFEIPVIWHRGLKALDLIGDVHGEDKVRRQLASGKGTIMLSPHLGNWELAGLWASTLGPTTILYQPPRQQGVEHITRVGRAKAGATLVPTNLRGVSALIKALKRGEITGILPDMEPDPASGVFAPFFGVPALTMTLVHNLQERSGAGVLLAFARRTAAGFDIEILEPEPALYDPDAATSVAALNRLVERSVEMAPEQYQWEYKRFKQQPDGQPKRYPRHSRK
jgi:KDO2-lipid IV(A) lauroyltransferase